MALPNQCNSTPEGDSSPSVHPRETTRQKNPEPSYREKLLLKCEAEYAATETAYEQLDSVQQKNRLDELRDCRTSAWYAVHLQSGTVRVLSSSCRQRWCPMCSAARSRLIVSNLAPWLQKRRSPKFLTLTLKHSDEDLSTQIIRLYACFSVFRRRVFVKRSIHAGVWFFQIKFSEQSQQWHPHLHCVLDADFMPHKSLKAIWKDVTGDSDIVDIRAVRDAKKVADYVARYAARPCKLSELNKLQQLQVLLAMHGRRLCGKWGDAKDLQLSQKPENVQDEYVVVCRFSDLKKLAEKSLFAEKIRQCFGENTPLDDIKSRADLENRVNTMFNDGRGIVRPPPPITEPVFCDNDGSWLSRRYH